MPHPTSGFVLLQSQDDPTEMEDKSFHWRDVLKVLRVRGEGELADHQLSVLVVPKRFELEGLV